MPNLPVGKNYSGGGTGQGNLEFGFSTSMGWRNELQRGVELVENLENEKTSSRVYSFQAGIGIWKGLSAQVTFPLLDLSYSEGDESGRDFGVGDLSLWLRYGVSLGAGRKPLKIGFSTGAYFPTGTDVQGDIPSNPNFVSGTVDPLLSLDLSYDFDFGLGFYVRIFTRLVAFENDDGYKAGHSFIYVGGLHYRLFDSLIPSIGLTALNRLSDRRNGLEVDASGGDWIYLTPSLSYVFVDGIFEGLSLYITAQIPLYQFLHGTQLADAFSLDVGLSYKFRVF